MAPLAALALHSILAIVEDLCRCEPPEEINGEASRADSTSPRDSRYHRAEQPLKLTMPAAHCASIAVAVSLSIAGLGSPQKPVKDGPINTYFNAPPATVSEMIASADLVVAGHVIGAKPADATLSPGNIRTMTNHRLKVDEVIAMGPGAIRPGKTTIESGSTIDIVRPGGDRDKGPYIDRSYQVGFPSFETGRRYLLFLTWNPSLSAWVPAYGPDSAFDLTDGTVVTSAGQAPVAQRLIRMSADDLLTFVRSGGV